MAILLLTSASGSPGVTTLAVGLALTWPRSVLLADCDPGAHQAVLAGYLAGQSANGKGLLRVAEAHRDGRSLREVVLDQAIPLTTDTLESRLFLPGFTKAGSANLFGGIWRDLSDAFDRLDDTDMDVIVDAGRVGPQGLPAPLLELATLSCLVLRSNLRSVMSARVHTPAIEGQGMTGSIGQSSGLIVVGEGEPYGKHEIAKALGLPVLATVAEDPANAQHLSDGKTRPRKFDASPLAKSLHTTATGLSAHLRRTAARIRS
jgi:hypothetical protein